MHEPLADLPEVAVAFDGAADLLRAWAAGLTPDPDLTVSMWADRHRILSPRGASEAGPWRTLRTPYLRDIMDALSPRHPAQRIVFMKGSQLGASEGGCCWIGYVIHHAPGPMLAVQPSVELAKRFSQQRIDPLIEESPALREKVAPARSRDSGNTVFSRLLKWRPIDRALAFVERRLVAGMCAGGARQGIRRVFLAPACGCKRTPGVTSPLRAASAAGRGCRRPWRR